MLRNGAIWFLLPALLLAIASTAGAHSGRTELKQIHQQLDQLRKQKQSSESERNRNEDALRKSELAISNINQQLSHIQVQEQSTHATLNALDRQIAGVRQSMQTQQNQLSSLLRHLHANGGHDDLQLLLDDRPAGKTQRDVVWAGYLQRDRQRLINELAGNAARLDDLRKQQQTLQAELASQQHEQERQRLHLQAEQKNRQTILARLGSTIARQQQQISNLEESEKRITRLMEELARAAARREAARKEAERRAAMLARHHRRAMPGKPATPAPAGQPEQPAENIAQPETPFVGFGLMKGKLPMPTRGTLVHRFGTPREAGGTLWKGLFIQAPSGQAVVSVGAGRVVFADWLRGFGNLIIIDHGEGYMSLYSDNETLYKRVGDIVKAGETIAAVGNTGGNNETGLYFELRYRSQAFDPYNWLSHR